MSRLALSCGFAALLLAQRLVTLAVASDVLDAAYVLGALLGATGDAAAGLLLSAVVLRRDGSAAGRARVAAGLIAAALWTFLSASAAHYEAALGRVPGFASLYYLGELDAIGASAATHAPWALLAIQVAAVTAALAVLVREAGRRLAGRPLGLAGTASAVACVALPLLTHGASVVPDAAWWGSRHWLFNGIAQGIARSPAPAESDLEVDARSVAEVRRLLGDRHPPEDPDPRHPLCDRSPAEPPPREGAARSVLLLVIESLDASQLEATVADGPLLPNLRRIAADGVHLRNVFAPGIRSGQALPAIFSGIPAQTHENLLWTRPLVQLPGFPKVLGEAGWRTAYLHGSDLSFEHQRTYLRRAGFQEILELDADGEGVRFGWGYDDGEMLRRLRAWADARRPEGDPWLAALFTIGTHDPYVLPAGHVPRLGVAVEQLDEPDIWGRTVRIPDERDGMMEAFRFLDEELGRFYDWYLEHERPRGTLLVITGDHAPHLAMRGAGPGGQRFRVPLILVGDGVGHPAGVEWRLGGAHDVPATLAGLLGVPPPPCSLGVDLLAPDFDERRFVYAVEGEELSAVYLWSGAHQLYVSRTEGSLRPIATEPPLGVSADGPPPVDRAARLLERLVPLNAWLVERDRYAPPSGRPARRAVAPGPLLVASHRGNIEGPGVGAPENSLAALERSADAGFAWAEVDLQLTADYVPVLLHDESLLVDGQPRLVAGLTLEALRAVPGVEVATLDELLDGPGRRLRLLLELKPQPVVAHGIQLPLQVARRLRARGLQGRVVVDSFVAEQISSLTTWCPTCATGWDTPPGRPVTDADLAFAEQMGVGWIYVDAALYTGDLLRRAHERGLRVMVYTVDEAGWVGARGAARPDGVMTDRQELVRALDPGR